VAAGFAVILAVFEIGFVCTKKGGFVEDSRQKSNLGDLLFTISDLLFRTDWGWLADFTLGSAKTAALWPAFGGQQGELYSILGEK
jgi:hypothetical protein